MAGARKFKFNADTPSFICAAAVRVRKGTLGTLELWAIGPPASTSSGAVISLGLEAHFVRLDGTS